MAPTEARAAKVAPASVDRSISNAVSFPLLSCQVSVRVCADAVLVRSSNHASAVPRHT